METLHIIHLKHRTDRLIHLHQQLAEQGISNFRIWENSKNGENPKKGIALAHKEIVKWGLSQNQPKLFIAEDDVKFTSIGSFDYFVGSEPNDYDLFLGGISYGNLGLDNSVLDFSGLHLFIIHHNFFQNFLDLPEENDIDRSMAGKGKFYVANPFSAIQLSGFSDNQNKNINFCDYSKRSSLF